MKENENSIDKKNEMKPTQDASTPWHVYWLVSLQLMQNSLYQSP